MPPQRKIYTTLFYSILLIACLSTIIVNILHHKLTNGSHHNIHATARHELKSNFLTPFQKDMDQDMIMAVSDRSRREWDQQYNRNNNNVTMKESLTSFTVATNNDETMETARLSTTKESDTTHQRHGIAGLSCQKYGGPYDAAAIEEMVYWSDIPSDSHFVSPFATGNDDDEEKFLTFEPDGGGWNNIRMAMETVVAMARAMGRTLVIPPEQGFYLLRKDSDKQKTKFSFADFFPLSSLTDNDSHKGLKLISMEDFLTRTALTGKLLNTTTATPSFPPDNRTNWNDHDPKPLKDYLRSVADVRNWHPDTCLFAIPRSPLADDDGSHRRLRNLHADVLSEKWPTRDDFLSHPTPVDAPPRDRLREVMNQRRDLCIYDSQMQNSTVVHFMSAHKYGARLLTHFYTFLFFEDWTQDVGTKRFVRDGLRYVDEIQCAAARVVEALRERARGGGEGDNNPGGSFDSMHVRRGDFQFKETRLDAGDLYESSREELERGGGGGGGERRVLYVATDERDKNFFEPFEEAYEVYFLDDFHHLIKGLNTNYYGMLEQLIVSKGRIFFGTYYSTFTGYINRLRGYHVTKHKLEGAEDGTLQSYYFAPPKMKHAMRRYQPIWGWGANWEREFPIAWRDIDKGIMS